MTVETCTPFLENIPAYALGALERDDSRALQEHLQTCASCQAELEAYTATAQGLLLSSPPQTPPPALRSRLEAHIATRSSSQTRDTMRPHSRTSAQTGDTSGVATRTYAHKRDEMGLTSQPPSARPSRTRLLYPATMAFAAALIVLFAVFNFFQFQTLQRQQAQLSAQLIANQTALAMLAYPETKTLPFSDGGITGSLLLDPDRNAAALVAWDLPLLQPNQIYQAWLIDAKGQRSSAGVFRPQAGVPFTAAAILSQTQLANYVAIGVTVEPLGGSLQPTGARVFKVDF